MSLALVYARALDGIEAPPVTVEVHLGNGLPQFHLVGLADTEVREARDRVRAAIQSAQFEFPQRRITVNLAPADLPKEGARYTKDNACRVSKNPLFAREELKASAGHACLKMLR